MCLVSQLYGSPNARATCFVFGPTNGALAFLFGMPYARHMNIDWQQLLADLESAGVKRADIGRACGLTRSSLCDLANKQGSQPKGAAAVALYEFHKRKMRKHGGAK